MAIQLYKGGESPVAINNGASPDGLYATNVSYSGSFYFVSVYKWNGSTSAYDELISNLFQFTNSGSVYITKDSLNCRWSADGQYLLIFNFNNGSKLAVFKRTGDTFEQLDDPSDVPADYIPLAVWHPVDNLFLVANQAEGHFQTYKVSEDDSVSQTQAFTLSANLAAEFSPNGQYVALPRYSSPYVPIYAKSGDTFVPFTNLSGISSYDNSLVVEWSPDGNYLAVRIDGSLKIYKVNGGAFDLLTSFSVNTTGFLVNRFLEWSPDSNYLLTAKNNNSGSSVGWTIFSRSGDTFTDIGTPGGAFTSTNSITARFLSSTLLLVTRAAISTSGSPLLADFLKLYQISGSSITELSDPLTESPTIPPSSNFGATSFIVGNGFGLGANDKLANIYFYNNASLVYSFLYFIWQGEGLFAKLDDVTVQINRMSALTGLTQNAVAKLRAGLDQAIQLGDAIASFNYGGFIAGLLDGAIASIAGDGGQDPVPPTPVTSPVNITNVADFAYDSQGVFFGNFSADDNYLVVNLWGDPYILIFKRNGSDFAPLDAPLDPPLDMWTYSGMISPDGNYLAVSLGDTRYVQIYKRDGDTFTLLDGALDIAPDTNVYNLAWSPDGNFLAAQEDGANGTLLICYQRDGDSFVRMSDPVQPALFPSGLAWSPDSQFLAVTSQEPAELKIYKLVDGALELTSTPNPPPDGLAAYQPSWDSTGNYLYIVNDDFGSGTSWQCFVYKRVGDSFVCINRIEPPSTSRRPFALSASPQYPLLAISQSDTDIGNGGELKFWLRSGDTSAPVLNQPNALPGFPPNLVVSPPTPCFGTDFLALLWTNEDPDNGGQPSAAISIYKIGSSGPPPGTALLTSSVDVSALSNAQTSIMQALSDFFEAGDSLAAKIEMMQSILSEAEADVLMSVLLHKTVVLIDNPQINATVSSQLTAEARMRDSVKVDAVFVIDGIPFAAWTVDRNTGAASEYQNWNFDSMCRLGNRYYGVNSDGLFLLDGDDDAGDPIAASFKTGDLDFGSPQIKKPLQAHIGYTTKGDMVLKVTVAHEGKRTEFWYRCKDPVHGEATEARVPLGKGMQSRHWQFELMNTNGADFEFESIQLQMLELSRRL